MKVLHIGLDDTLGGIERFIINYFNACSSNVFFGFITTVNEFKYSLDDMIKNKKYQVHHVTNITNPVKYVLSVKMIIDQFNYDVVHIHKNSLANILPIIAAKLSHVDKIIVHAHSSQPSRHRMIGSVLHKINKNFLCQFKIERLACSKTAAEWMFGNKKSTIIYNAINISYFQYNLEMRKKLRKEMNLDNNCLTIGSIARISPEKNQLFLLNIIYRIIQKRPQSKLILIGGFGNSVEEIKYNEKVLDKIKKLHLENNVILLGSRDDAYKYYQVFDVFVLPSKWEGLGIVAIEAQVSGLKCICSENIPSEAKVIDDIFVTLPLDDINSWCNEIIKPYERIDRYNEFINSNYNIDNEVKALMTIYNKQ